MTTADDRSATLNARDRETFARYGIDLDLASEAGVRRLNDAEARVVLGSNHKGDLSGLYIPYMDPTSGHVVTARIRRDHPEVDNDGRAQRKYMAASGDQPHIFFPPAAREHLADVTVPVVLVEAEKSALCVTATARRAHRPMLSVALGGCNGWRTQRSGKTADASGARVNVPGPQPDLALVSWQLRDATILFDSNAATNWKVRQARRQLADELIGRGARVRIGTVPAEPGVNGPDDYRAAHDDPALLRLIDDAVPVQPATVDELLEEYGAFALPSPTNASQAEPVILSVREALRGASSFRVAAVRSRLVDILKQRGVRDGGHLVDAALGGTPEPDAAAGPFLADPEPWPDPVDGAALLDSIVALLRRYMFLPTLAAEAMALWVLHAYLMPVWNTSPILAVLSPVKRCGKSTLMELIGALVCRALLVSNLSTASLFRAVQAYCPTLLSDEADTWLSDETSELRGIFNSGWRRGTAKVLRCDGDMNEPTIFSTWAAKAIAAIGRLPDTIADRSITISLRRKTGDEAVTRYRHDRVTAETGPLQRQLRRWADDHATDVARLDPDDLDQLHDRASDNWRPLRMLSLVVGGDWPARADAAALTLSGVEADSDDDIGAQLLGDIKVAFGDGVEDVLPSAVLRAALVEMTDRPWAEWSKGSKPITPNKIARLLRPFGVVPVDTWIAGKTLKAYRRAAFTEVWERYLAQDPNFKPQDRRTPNESRPESAILKAQENAAPCGRESEESSMNTGLPCGLADSTPKTSPATLFEEL